MIPSVLLAVGLLGSVQEPPAGPQEPENSAQGVPRRKKVASQESGPEPEASGFDQFLEHVYGNLEEARERERRQSALELAHRWETRLHELETGKDKDSPESKKEAERIRQDLEQLAGTEPWGRKLFDPIFVIDGRLEVRHNVDPTVPGANEDSLLHFRWGLGFQSRVSEDVRATVLAVQSRTWFAENSGLRQQDYLNLYAAWADVRLYDEGIPAVASAGRMPIHIGEGRMVGQDWWSNDARSFDALEISNRSWIGEPLHSAYIDTMVFAGRPVQVPRGVTDNRKFNRSDPDVTLIGASSKLELEDETTRIGAYLLRDTDLNPSTPSDFGPGTRRVNTAGLTGVGDLLPSIELGGEAAYQWGEVAGGPQSAWALHAQMRFHAPEDAEERSWWIRRGIFLEYNYASGDRNPTDGRSGTFLTPYPSPHALHGIADLVGWQNMEEYAVRWQLSLGSGKPGQRTGERSTASRFWDRVKDDSYFEFGYHKFFLASRRDAYYGARGEVIGRDVTGKASGDLGTEFDFCWTFDILEIGYARFRAGQFLADTGAAKDASIFYMSLFRGF